MSGISSIVDLAEKLGKSTEVQSVIRAGEQAIKRGLCKPCISPKMTKACDNLEKAIFERKTLEGENWVNFKINAKTPISDMDIACIKMKKAAGQKLTPKEQEILYWGNK